MREGYVSKTSIANGTRPKEKTNLTKLAETSSSYKDNSKPFENVVVKKFREQQSHEKFSASGVSSKNQKTSGISSSSAKGKAPMSELRMKYETLKSSYNDAVKSIAGYENEIAGLKTKIDVLKISNTKLETDKERLASENEKLCKSWLAEKEKFLKQDKKLHEFWQVEKNEFLQEHVKTVDSLQAEKENLLKENEKLISRLKKLEADEIKVKSSSDLNKANPSITSYEPLSNKMCLSPSRVGNVSKQCVLRCLSVLDANKWITDDTIQLYFNLLSSKVTPKEVYLLDPSIAQAIKCVDDIDDFLEPILMEKSYIFIPVNNSEAEFHNHLLSDREKEEGSGSHWSLLVYVQTNKTFYHFDSIAKLNSVSAQKLATKLSKHLSSSQNLSFVNVKSPQQPNSVDCGIYVTLFTDILIREIVLNAQFPSDSEIEAIFPKIIESNILTKRGQLAWLSFKNQHATLSGHNVFCLMSGSRRSSER